MPPTKRTCLAHVLQCVAGVMLLLLAVCLVVAVLVMTWFCDPYNQRTLIYNRQRLPHNHIFKWSRSLSRYACEERVYHAGKSRFPISTLLFRTSAPVRGLIFMCRGFNSCMQIGGERAIIFLEAGYDVFLFDYRGGGKSHRPDTSSGESLGEMLDDDTVLSDAQEMLQHAIVCRGQNGYPHVVLWGHSAGAAPAAYLAAQSNVQAQGLVLESAITDMPSIFDFHFGGMGRSLLRDRWDCTQWMRRLRTKQVLILQGINDTTIPPDTCTKLAKAAEQAKTTGVQSIECVRLSNVGHTDQSRASNYPSLIRAFLARL